MAERLARADLGALSFDDRGRPTMVRSLGRRAPTSGEATAEARARDLVAKLRTLEETGRGVELTDADVRTLGSDATLTTFEQRIDGVRVFGGRLSVLATREGRLFALSGVIEDAGDRSREAFTRTAEQAVVAGLGARGRQLASLRPRTVAGATSEWTRFEEVRSAGFVATGLRARRVYFVTHSGLVPAYEVELVVDDTTGRDSDARRVLIHASTEAILAEHELSANDTFRYKVFADEEGNPSAGPQDDWHPYPFATRNGSVPAFATARTVSVESLKVLPEGAIDPWLPAGATTTVGNNVDAYSDYSDPDGLNGSDFRASVTAPGAFEYTFDQALPATANVTQQSSAIVQAFYTVNHLHDTWYDFGFDEAAGNAQTSNFGRGGEENDAIRVELQDGYSSGSRDNANMRTPADGERPRMQLFVWSGRSNLDATMTAASSGQVIEPGFEVSTSFGPQQFAISGQLVRALDSVGPSTLDGCQALTNSVSGAIAVVDRGACDYTVKAMNAQNSGAVAVIVVNNVPGLARMGGTNPLVTIPAILVSTDSGAWIDAQLVAGTVSTTFSRSNSVERDSGLDVTIVQHEWGHFLHNRLTSYGNEQSKAMSEGWGDFVALHAQLREGDSLDGAYAVGAFAVEKSADYDYFGIRRYPYSRSFARMPLMFGHVRNGATLPELVDINPNTFVNSEVHNAGELWAATLFDAYLDTIDAHGFAPGRREFARYVVHALRMMPRDATFTEARDALLLVAEASREEDAERLAAAFARRGLGSCARSPARSSVDFVDAVEDVTIGPNAALVSLEMAPTSERCAADGILDSNEVGELSVLVQNLGNAGDVTITFATDATDVTIDEPEQTLRMASRSTRWVRTSVRSTSTRTEPYFASFFATTTAASSCGGARSFEFRHLLQAERVANGSSVATFDIDDDGFSSSGTEAESIWKWSSTESTGSVMHGANSISPSDTSLVTPLIEVGDEAFELSLTHAFSFELDDGGVCYDGAVIEFTRDGGSTWEDVTALASASPYTGTIYTQEISPLSGRSAFCLESVGFPARTATTLAFGTSLANSNVRFRFRIGTDAAAGGLGWFIDSLAVSGAKMLPFVGVAPNVCVSKLVANAGADASVEERDELTLHGEVSTPNDSASLTYAWVQVSGPSAVLRDAATTTPTLVAPAVDVAEEVTLRFTATDRDGEASDEVVIAILPRADAPDAGAPEDAGTEDGGGVASPRDDSGCGCTTAGENGRSTPSHSALALALALLVGLGRRERARRGR